MKLASLLDPDLILIRPRVASRKDAVGLIIERIFRDYSFELSAEEIRDMVSKRDALGATVMPSGISVQHVRLDGFKDLVVGICLPDGPVSVEGVDVRLFFLIISDKAAPGLYLNTLAAIVGLSRDPVSLEEMISAKSPQEFVESVKNRGADVKKALTVADIMARDVATVGPDTTLTELIDLFSKFQYSYAPVVDPTGTFVGEVNVRDALRLGIPEYATMVGNLKFLSSFEPLDDFLKNEAAFRVRDFMKKPSITFAPDTSIVEAVLVMSQNRRRHVAVVKDGKVLGLVSIMDILNKVIRG